MLSPFLRGRDEPRREKRQVAEAALEEVRHLLDPKTPIGIGTGSTANCFIDVLAESKTQVLGAVASSKATAERLTNYGIEILDLNATGTLPVYIDGADEADPQLNLVKGGGAALTMKRLLRKLLRNSCVSQMIPRKLMCSELFHYRLRSFRWRGA